MNHSDTGYRAAFNRVNITPELADDVRLQGFYTATPRVAEKIVSPLELNSLLIEDAAFNKVLVVSADIFGFDPRVVTQIRKAIRGWGIPPEALILNASHTHYAPGTTSSVLPSVGELQPEFVRRIATIIVRQMGKLYGALEPCTISSGRADARVGCSRRTRLDNGQTVGVPNGSGYYHSDTPLLLLTLHESDSRIMVASHGCHPTGLDGEPVISADYPGYLRAILRQSAAIDHVLFLQGAAGSSKQAVKKDGRLQWKMANRDIVENAVSLTRSISAAIDDTLRDVSGPIVAARRELSLPVQSLPSPDALVSIRDNAEQPRWHREWAQIWFQKLTEKGADREALRHVPLQVQLVGLGDQVCFLTFDGEPVGELARNLLRRTDLPEDTFVLGYTNGLQGYIPTADMIAEGGYEVDLSQKIYRGPSAFTRGVEDRVTASVNELTEDRRAPRPSAHFPTPDPKDQSAFFCLSTGRCGTKTLSSILKTASNADVYHHPQPFLVEETLQAYHNNIDKSATFWRARCSIVRRAWMNHRVFGELDHNMTPFASMLASEIPSARFLVLVRNPWDFVRSAMRRRYYRGHMWDRGRLRPEPGRPDYDRWDTMDPFEKSCWLWNETYSRIRSYLNDIPEKRYRIVHFEEVVRGPACAQNLFDYLGLEGFDAAAVTSILSQKLNRQTTGDFPPPTDWSQTKHEALWRECAPTIRAFEYEDSPRERDFDLEPHQLSRTV